MTKQGMVAVLGATLLAGVALIVAAALIGQGIVNFRVGDRAVSVHGLAERDVKADLAILPLRFTRTGDNLSDAQSQIDADTLVVRRFLASQGYGPAEIDLGNLQVTDLKAREFQQSNAAAPRFILAQTVIVRTRDVDRVSNTARALGPLVREGIVLQSFAGPSYIFTGLNGVRPEMISAATASARAGAARFAKDSGAALGDIQEATQGSFEILPRDDAAAPGGDGVAEGGERSSLWKRLRVVTTVRYRLK